MGIPLSLRIPNPPPHFVGRADLLDGLGQVLETHPVVVLWGLEGLGKSAAVHAFCHAHPPMGDTGKILYLGAAQSGWPRSLATRLNALLGESEPLDWRQLASQVDLAEAIIDMADRFGGWIVLDALPDDEASERWLSWLATYSRQARWLVTRRTMPGLQEGVACVALEPLSQADMRTLATALGASDGLHIQAKGSPGLLKRLMAHRAGRPDVLAALELVPQAQEALALLAAVDGAVPAALLRALCDPEILLQLERRALVHHTDQGYTTFDIVADAASRWPLPTFKSLLGPDCSPEMAAHCLSTFLQAGLWDNALTLIEGHGEAILEASMTHLFWPVLEVCLERRLQPYKLRCATWMGVFCEDLDAPTLDDVEGCEVWLEYLHACCRNAQMLEFIGEEPQVERYSPRTQLLIGLSYAQFYRHEPAQKIFRAVLLHDKPQIAAMAHMGLANTLATEGRKEEARVHIHALLQMTKDLSVHNRGLCEQGIARAWYVCGELALANAAIVRAQETWGAIGIARQSTRRNLFFWLAVASDMGQLETCRTLIERLRRFSQPFDESQAILDSTEVLIALYAGPPKDWLARVTAVQHGKYTHNLPDVICHASISSMRLHELHGLPIGFDSPRPNASDNFARYHQLRIGEQRLLRGQTVTLPEVDGGTDEMRAFVLMLQAMRAAIEGDHGRAQGLFERGRVMANRASYHLIECDILQRTAEHAIIAGLPQVGAHTAAALAALAKEAGAARLEVLARFYEAVCQDDLSAMWTEAHSICPAARRLWRAALGQGAPGNQWETWLSAAIHRTRAPESVLAAAKDGPLWAVGDGCVYRDDGQIIEVQRHQILWRFLTALVQGGGGLELDPLVCFVWNEQEYHPLKHDNRLRLAARKLRKLIEHDPANPTMIITSDNAYVLGGTVVVL